MSHHMSHNNSFQLFPTTELHIYIHNESPLQDDLLKTKSPCPSAMDLNCQLGKAHFLQVTQACNSLSEQARSRSNWLIHVLGSGYLRLLQAASGAHKVG